MRGHEGIGPSTSFIARMARSEAATATAPIPVGIRASSRYAWATRLSSRVCRGGMRRRSQRRPPSKLLGWKTCSKSPRLVVGRSSSNRGRGVAALAKPRDGRHRRYRATGGEDRAGRRRFRCRRVGVGRSNVGRRWYWPTPRAMCPRVLRRRRFPRCATGGRSG